MHAIIGPNGAGKTTLIGQLAGELVPDAGRIHFDGRDITALPVHGRSLLGLARSFQITSLFPRFHRARQCRARRAGACRPFVPVLARRARREPDCASPRARRSSASASASAPNAVLASMSHGEHRQLEIAMALASQPRMLLLDEPMAGMGPDESARMVKTLRELKRELTILLIEHDMEAVFALADRITVLVYGRVIASGDAGRDPRQRRGAPGLSRRAGGGAAWLSTLLEVDEHRDAATASARCCSACRSRSRRAKW